MKNSPSISIYHDNISHFAPVSQEVVRQLIRALVNLAICEGALHGARPFGFDHTFPVGKLLGIACEYLMDG